ncbi:MAG TPA: FtsX-like permease family protein [Firmicutes bacterium]|nr:FtsX-like permease family protein [Bacillota bacterium]
MNIVSKVTVKHLQQNRKRTIVTILGIMLSVALIVAISAFAESFLDMMRQSAIASGGEWHVLFMDVPKDQLPEIMEDSRVKETLLSRDEGSALLEGAQNEYKPYLLVKAYDETAMKNYPTTLLEGRYPEKEGEIVLPKHLETDGGIAWKVGDTISLELGDRYEHSDTGDYEMSGSYGLGENETLENLHTARYTVVGIIERPEFESYAQAAYTAITYLDVDAAGGTETINAAVALNHVDNSLYTWGDELADELGVSHQFNTSLLSYYMLSGNSTIVGMLSAVKWIMVLIVAAGSVAVIYSSFSISISERSRYLGMLASVGATKKQKRNSVLTEAVILGAIGIPLGLVLGYAGVFVTTRCIRGLISSTMGLDNVTMRVIISWPGILGAVILAVLTILISAWIPAARASRITPVEAIRQTRDIKLTSKQVKTSALTRKLFGFEGELALKNLKRNKKRYRATVLSLVFCIALYLSVASFTAYLSGAYRMQLGMDSANLPDITVSLYDTEEQMLEDAERDILSLDHITEHVTVKETGVSCYLKDGSVLTDEVRQAFEGFGSMSAAGQDVGPYGMYFNVIGMDEDSLSAFARETGADSSILFDGKKTGVIMVNRREDHTEGKTSWKSIFTAEKGDSIDAQCLQMLDNPETDEYEETLADVQFTVAGTTETLPLGGSYYGDINTVSVYTTFENVLKLNQLVYGEGTTQDRTVYLRTDDHDSLMAQLRGLEEKQGSSMYIYSAVEEYRTVENMLILINVFVYGFIILTALICVTSIFNTISTSMALRRREYAMLKSVGMDPGRFGRMIAYESVFYGLKALLYGLPAGLILMYGIYRSIASAIDTGFYIIWSQIAVAVVSVMAVIGLTMWYSSRKIKKANIVDVLKNENI